MSDVTPLWLLNHLLRTYVFAELLGRRSEVKCDSEVFYLGAIMQDLGLTDEFSSVQRFELDGADAASRFLLKHGISKHRVDLVWDSIAFHTSGGIYDRMPAEIALVGFGVLADTTGTGIEKLPPKQAREECSGGNLRVRVERLNDFHLSLPESEEFLRGPHQRSIERPRLRGASSEKGELLITTDNNQNAQQTGAAIVVQTLQQRGVKHVFGVSCAKIDKCSTRWPTPILRPLFAGMSKMPHSSPAASDV